MARHAVRRQETGANAIRWRRIAWMAALLLVFAGAGAAAGFVATLLRGLPPVDRIDAFAARTSTIYDVHGNPVTPIPGSENHYPLRSIDDVPPVVRNAFVAIEDQRFYEHHGVDVRGTLRAAWEDLVHHRAVAGGSTITQQLARNAFPIGSSRTLRRKVQEAILALELERHYTKPEILQYYLDSVYFGEHAVGIAAAARTYFATDVQHLNLAQGALLAGLVQAPSAYDPYVNPGVALDRRNVVLEKMAQLHYITPQEAAAAERLPLSGVAGKDLAPRPQPGTYPYPSFVDYVLKLLKQKFTDQEIFEGGLHVYTTLDPKIQQAAEDAVHQVLDPVFPLKANPHLESAVAVLDQSNGYVVALVGGREHSRMLELNRAVDARRQPGSAMKPLAVYTAAFDAGLTPATVVDDSPATYPSGSGPWVPMNYDGKYRGLTTLTEAVRRSVNTVAVKVLARIGVDRGFQMAERLGITDLKPSDRNLSLALGGTTDCCTPLEMARAYATIANEGVRVDPIAILRVVDSNGNVLMENRPVRQAVVSPSVAYLMLHVLEAVVEPQADGGWIENWGTGAKAAVPGWPTAGKTGTTSDDKDAWFVGLTPKYTAAVWLGYDHPRVMNDVFGGDYGAPIFRLIMQRALAGQTPTDFPVPPDIVSVTIDAKSGLLPGPLTPPEWRRQELFRSGTEPTQTSNAWISVPAVQLPGPPGPGAPSTPVWVRWDPGCPLPPATRVFLNRPPVTAADLQGEARALRVSPGSLVPADMAMAVPTQTCTRMLGGSLGNPPAGGGRAGQPPAGQPATGGPGESPNPGAGEPGNPTAGPDGVPTWHVVLAGGQPFAPPVVNGRVGQLLRLLFEAADGRVHRVISQAPGCPFNILVPADAAAPATCTPAAAGSFPLQDADDPASSGMLVVGGP